MFRRTPTGLCQYSFGASVSNPATSPLSLGARIDPRSDDIDIELQSNSFAASSEVGRVSEQTDQPYEYQQYASEGIRRDGGKSSCAP